MSVSGIRGIVNESFTKELVYTIAKIQSQKYPGKIIVATDTRPTGILFAKAAINGILSSQSIPVDIGIVPTPTACVAVKHFEASGGIIITASHNPITYNGYKMIHKSGRLFSKFECEEIYSEFFKNKISYKEADNFSCVQKQDAVSVHIQKILASVNVELIKSAKIKVAVDSINGAAGVIFPKLLDKLGVEWKGINNKLDGDFTHNPEPRPENLTQLSDLISTSKDCWAGFAFDPDADRLALMAENGEFLTEELTLVLALENVLAKKKSSIAVNLSTSMMVDDVAKKFGVPVIRTKIGEANVVEAMINNNCIIGGEGNGGVIYPAVSTVRDGLTAMALILELMASKNMPLSEIVRNIPQYFIIKEKIPCTKDSQRIISILAAKFKNEKIDTQDGLKIIRDYGWVHVRPSNTEPIIRCYSEAITKQQAHELVQMIIEEINKL
jgi:phosphomannomutase